MKLLRAALTIAGEALLDGAAWLRERELRRRVRRGMSGSAIETWLRRCAEREDDDG